MKIPFVDLYCQYSSIKDEIDKAIHNVIKESSFLRGPHVEKFETNFSNMLGIQHCISCANGTDALYIAMNSLGLEPGDEVITTAHSWISTSETISQAGGKVVFCDTNDYYTIDVNRIESKITTRTKGIIPVHLYGQAADMDFINRIAKKYGLWVIEDCAQAHFAKYKNQLVGTLGDIATFSFYPGKNLGAMGDAGCLVSSNQKLAKFAETFSRHGGKGEHLIEGINSRMDGIQAAILNVKLNYILDWTQRRQNIANKYHTLLENIEEIQTPLTAENNEHVYHLYVIRAKDRNNLREFLRDKGIATSLNYPKALPFYKAYSYLGHKFEDFPTAYEHQSKILSLPLFPELKDEQIQYICNNIKEFYRK